MPADLWLPVTPSIRRLAAHYLTGTPPTSDAWWPILRGWYRAEAGGWGDRSPAPILPLHIPAGLAIARVRLGEVLSFDRHFDSVNIIGDMVEIGGSGWGHCFRLPTSGPDIIRNQPAAVAHALRHLDPELREAADAP